MPTPETTDFERAIELSAKAGIKTQPIFLDAYRVMRDAERRLCILDHALGQLRALVAQACDQIEADASSSAWHARFVEIGREELARDVE